MYDVSLKRFECLNLSKNDISVKCSANLINRNTTYLQASGMSNYSDVYPTCRMTLYYRFSNNMYRKFMVDVKLQLCDIIRGQQLGEWLFYTFNHLKKFSNINGCPLKKVS